MHFSLTLPYHPNENCFIYFLFLDYKGFSPSLLSDFTVYKIEQNSNGSVYNVCVKVYSTINYVYAQFQWKHKSKSEVLPLPSYTDLRYSDDTIFANDQNHIGTAAWVALESPCSALLCHSVYQKSVIIVFLAFDFANLSPSLSLSLVSTPTGKTASLLIKLINFF